MIKKILLFFIIGLFLINSVFAANIAYLVKNPLFLDEDEIVIKNTLLSDGHNVDVLDEDGLNFPGMYSVIVVGEDINDVGDIFDNKNHKTVFLSKTAAKNAGVSFSTGKSSGNKITIANVDSIITFNIMSD